MISLVTLENVAADEANAFVDGPFGSNLKAAEYKDHGVPIVRLQNILPHAFLKKDIKFITEEKAESLARHDFRAGDLVIAKLGDPTGVSCIVPDGFGPGRIVADVVRFRGDPNKVDHSFISRFLNSPTARWQLEQGTTGTTRKRINLTKLKTIKVPLPPLDEQKRIAAILDAADTLRAKRREAIAQLDKLLESTFLEMFGDGKKNPNAWPSIKIGDLVRDARGGASLKPSDFTETGFPVLHKGAIKPKGIVVLDGGKKTFTSVEYAKSKLRSVVSSDFTVVTLRDLVPSGPSIGLAANLERAEHPEHLLAQGVYGFRLDQNKIAPDYFVALSNDKGFRTELRRFAVGSTQIHIRNPVYQKIQIPVPPLDLQNRFAGMVESVWKQKATQRAHLAELNTLFASLQQRAFNGEL